MLAAPCEQSPRSLSGKLKNRRFAFKFSAKAPKIQIQIRDLTNCMEGRARVLHA
jgi:hypothetical protein